MALQKWDSSAGAVVDMLPQEEATFLATQASMAAPSVEQSRIAAYKAEPSRQTLVALIQGSTPAQINTYLANNVTSLAQARTVLGQLILLIGGNSVA